MRTTKAQQELVARIQAAWEAGFEHYRDRPDDILTEVHRLASRQHVDKREAFAFVEGYSAARLQRDEYEREKNLQTK